MNNKYFGQKFRLTLICTAQILSPLKNIPKNIPNILFSLMIGGFLGLTILSCSNKGSSSPQAHFKRKPH